MGLGGAGGVGGGAGGVGRVVFVQVEEWWRSLQWLQLNLLLHCAALWPGRKQFLQSWNWIAAMSRSEGLV